MLITVIRYTCTVTVNKENYYLSTSIFKNKQK